MITIKKDHIIMSAEEYNEYVEFAGIEGKVDTDELAKIEIWKSGELDGKPYDKQNGKPYLSNYTYRVNQFYRPENEADPTWTEIVEEIIQFAEEKNIKLKNHGIIARCVKCNQVFIIDKYGDLPAGHRWVGPKDFDEVTIDKDGTATVLSCEKEINKEEFWKKLTTKNKEKVKEMLSDYSGSDGPKGRIFEMYMDLEKEEREKCSPNKFIQLLDPYKSNSRSI